MKIVKIETFALKAPLERTIKMSIGSVSEVDHVVVKIYANTDVCGLGEVASEYGPIFSEEFQVSIKACIDNYLAPSIIGDNPMDLERIIEKMDRAAKGNWFAKSAINMALLDIVGKQLNLPVYNLLGGLYRSKVPLAYGAYSMDIDEEVEGCQSHVSSGWTLIKMKVGVLDPGQDVVRLREIREAVGPECRIGVDVNQGWARDKAIKIIKAMESYDIQFVEQPIPRWDLLGMAEVARAVDTPIMADESIFTPEDAIRCIQSRAAEIFSVKVSKAGGLWSAKKIAAIAQAAGIPCYVGGMAEMGIGAAAGIHFAVSTPNCTYGCEIKPNCIKDIVIPEIKVENGHVFAPEGPGLGVEIDEDVMKDYLVK